VINQELWDDDARWDDEVPAAKQELWEQEIRHLKETDSLKFSRHFHLDEMRQDETTLEIITCCDASSKLYAACTYLRVTVQGRIYSTLAACRARVAPKKKMTIPRLELTAAVVATRLAAYVKEELRLPQEWMSRVTMKYYTDSAIAYYWIVQEKYQSMTFVHNRCEEIRSATSITEWSHIRTEENMADFPSRPGSYRTRPHFLQDWQEGLPWMREGREPAKASLEMSPDVQVALDAEQKKEKSAVVLLTNEGEGLLDQLTKLAKGRRDGQGWSRLVRILCYVNRLACTKPDKGNIPVSREHVLKSESQIIRLVQKRHFPREMKARERGETIPEDSVLAKLNPTLMNGILRMDSRIALEEGDSLELCMPIILPNKDPLVDEFVMQCHFEAMHAKTERTMDILFTKYWMSGAATAVRRIIKECWICRLKEKKNLQPQMGKLPSYRTIYNGTWNHTIGIDFTGPFYVSVPGNKAKKVYVMIFVDAVIRLLTLVVTKDMSTDSVIKGLEEYCATRGAPSRIISDNGSSLVAASRNLKRLYDQVNWKAVMQWYAPPRECFSWSFIPAYSPWVGGFYEIFNRIFKSALNHTYGIDVRKEDKQANNLALEEFRLALKKTEAVVNDCPLYVPSRDEDAEQSITPSELAFGQRMHPLPDLLRKPVDETDKAMKLRQRASKIFAAHWRQRYLRSLKRYEKWIKTGRGVRVGDLVQINHKNTQAGWRIGTVQELCSSSRSAEPTTVVVRLSNKYGDPKSEIVSVRRLKLLEATRSYEDEDSPDGPFPLPDRGPNQRRPDSPTRSPKVTTNSLPLEQPPSVLPFQPDINRGAPQRRTRVPRADRST
jgi:hypothetical protein